MGIQYTEVRAPRGSGGSGGPGRFQPPPEIMERFDKNKDGQLDNPEREAMRAERNAQSGGSGRPGAPGAYLM